MDPGLMHILALLEAVSNDTFAGSGSLEISPSPFQAPVSGSRFIPKKSA
jgi:hypothetical protein